MMDVQCLSDRELHNQLEKRGFSPGPILPSTRKMYERKLVELLVSPPCELPILNRPRQLDGDEDSDNSEEVNIILKGNIRLSAEKGKEYKKNLVFEVQGTQEQQQDMASPDSVCEHLKMSTKRPEASTNKRRSLDTCCLSQKPTKRVRCAARPGARIKHGCVIKGKDYCMGSQSPESSFPWSLKLAVLGIFIIVLFVYITVEKKPLFG